jgi:predicted lipoprotein
MRRSDRSARNVALSLTALTDLGAVLAQDDEVLQQALIAQGARMVAALEGLERSDFSQVSDPTGRFQVDAISAGIGRMRDQAEQELGPHLGVILGFNALDGD